MVTSPCAPPALPKKDVLPGGSRGGRARSRELGHRRRIVGCAFLPVRAPPAAAYSPNPARPLHRSDTGARPFRQHALTTPPPLRHTPRHGTVARRGAGLGGARTNPGTTIPTRRPAPTNPIPRAFFFGQWVVTRRAETRAAGLGRSAAKRSGDRAAVRAQRAAPSSPDLSACLLVPPMFSSTTPLPKGFNCHARLAHPLRPQPAPLGMITCGTRERRRRRLSRLPRHQSGMTAPLPRTRDDEDGAR